MENNKKSFGEIWAELNDEQREYLKGYVDRQRQDAVKHYQAEQLRIGGVSDKLILTPKDAEIFFNEIMNPKEANEALKKAMLKFITCCTKCGDII